MSDIEFFKKNVEFNKTALDKDEGAGDVTDVEENKYEKSWEVLMEKGYKGAGKHVRAITPTKKPIGRVLNRTERDINYETGKDRVLVEKYSGRL